MKLAILGSTGSIGTQALAVIDPSKVEVTVLTCGSNIQLILDQYHVFKPQWLVVNHAKDAQTLSDLLKNQPVKIRVGIEGLVEVAALADYDIILTSVVGAVGLRPTIEAVKRGKRIALANKETLVVYGQQIMQMALEYKAEIIPVDSEHSALFQALQGNDLGSVEKLILTASGGPFRGKTKQDLMGVTKHQALKHPNWSMGAKITIDSSTLMNKGLEVIEAKWLFDMDHDRIDVVVHPESIIHSLVQYKDSSVMAQMGVPDMKLPIHYALYYPNRVEAPLERLDLTQVSKLTFYQPDLLTFPCLDLAYEVLKRGGGAPCVLNATNEILVDRFLKEEIGFYDIPRGIERVLDAMGPSTIDCLDTVLSLDSEARQRALALKFEV